VRVSGGETPPFRPPIPPNDKTNDPQLIQMMRDCWDENSVLRPDFSTIRSRFVLINKGKYDIQRCYFVPPLVNNVRSAQPS